MVHFSGRNLIDNVFLLVTTVLAFAAWVIAFAGLCALRATGAYWWVMIFELALVVGIIFLIITSSFAQYRLVILAFLAVSISYITGQLSTAIPLATDGRNSSARGAGGAFAAGYIVLIIIQIIWVFAFGSEPHSYVGKFAQHNRNSVQQHPHHSGGAVAAGAAGAAAQSSLNNNNHTPNETIQDKTAYENSPNNQSPTMTHPSMATSPVLEYNERVEALHEYRANPEDPSELSFDRGDILEIVDRRGNWWQARKSDGSTGIIPSNYFA
ncbi:hypothetical protein BCR42DRAFT_426604 [Absidia repens]|uniref:SH3 domain-containing protein n=1 Tax=Absidia repens TaxID=90262 RepID=A0A1X2I0M9_9FUNG|nr:hypothetical protein BCR42DRAFT_426604 [Absidia repens]